MFGNSTTKCTTKSMVVTSDVEHPIDVHANYYGGVLIKTMNMCIIFRYYKNLYFLFANRLSITYKG